jgi:hypothetical protein
VRQLAECIEGRALPAALKDADIVAMQAGDLSEFFLGYAPFQTEFAQSFSKENSRGDFSHECDGTAFLSSLSTHDHMAHDNLPCYDGRVPKALAAHIKNERPLSIGASMVSTARLRIAAICLMVTLFASMPATAKSVKDFEAMPTPDQSKYLADFIEKMTADLGKNNPKLEQDIRDYFSKKQSGKPVSDGVEKVMIELTALDSVAKDGKADLSNIQIESIVVYVVKQKFPPPAAQN